MSVEQIEEQIRRLPVGDLTRLAEWLGQFLAARASEERSGESGDWPESPEIIAELEKRLAEFKANPAVAIPFAPDYFDNLKRQLGDERAKKASTR